MVASVRVAMLALVLAGCASGGEDVSKRRAVDPNAAASQGAAAQNLEDWSKANAGNGAPGESDK